MSTAIDVEVFIESLEDEFGGIPCQGQSHPRGVIGHVPDAPAKYIMMCPNCGPRTAQCAGRVESLRRGGFVICNACRKSFPFERWGVVEL